MAARVRSVTEARPETKGGLSWDIKRWEDLPSGPGEESSSAVMVVAGHQWKLIVRPGGWVDPSGADAAADTYDKDWISLKLDWLGRASCTVDPSSLELKYTVRIVNQIPGKGDRRDSTIESILFPRKAFDDGWHDFFLKQTAMADESKGWKVNGRVLIEGDIVVLGKAKSRVLPSSALPALEGPTLQQDMLSLKNDGDSSDVTFVVGVKRFQAHSQIVATRSSVLRAMLAAPMAEAKTRIVTVEDIEPSVFEALLKFMYTDEFNIVGGGGEEGFLMALLDAADRYDVPRLQRMCERALCQSTDVDNVLERLAFAEAHGPCTARLREHCVVLAAQNIAELISTAAFRECLSSELALEVMHELNGSRKRSHEEMEGDDGAAAKPS